MLLVERLESFPLDGDLFLHGPQALDGLGNGIFAVLAAAGALFAATPAVAADSPVVGTWATEAKSDYGTFKSTWTVAENGGAYTMVLQTIGRRMALVVGSMTILSYLATAVVSALSGSLYLSAIWGGNWPSWLVAIVAAIPVLGFAALNLVGLKESAKLVVAISTFHFAMLIVMDVWGIAMSLNELTLFPSTARIVSLARSPAA